MLAWDANVEPDIAGYRLYYGTVSGEYTEMVDVGTSTTASLPSLPVGATYFFAVTAYNADGLESQFSNEASFTQPPGAVGLATRALEADAAGRFLPGLINPNEMAIIDSQRHPEDGTYEFAVVGPVGGTVAIRSSTDLVTWTLLCTIRNNTGLLLVTDFEATARSRSRFYQVFKH
jgi:hypothetical protein